MNGFLRSARLAFRHWQPSDLTLAVSLWGDRRVTRWIAATGWSEQQVRERLEHEIEQQASHGVQYWPIFLSATGDFAGCCGLRPRHGESAIYEIGVHLRPEFWGQGLAMEATLAVIQHAFEALDATALFAGHNPRNVASAALLGRLGFHHTHDEYYEPTGLIHPSYRLTRADWADLRGTTEDVR